VCATFAAAGTGTTEEGKTGHGLSLFWWFLLAMLMFLIIFVLIRDRFTLTYDLNGGIPETGPGEERGLVAQEDRELDLTRIPKHAGIGGRKVAFVGWSPVRDERIYSMTDNVPATVTTADIVNDDVTLYAVWGYDTNGDGIPDVSKYSNTSTVAEWTVNRMGADPPSFRIKERRRRGWVRPRL